MDRQQKFENFSNQKKQALGKKDKSSKKEIDEKAREIVEEINKNKFMFTTSSCSGRAILIREKGRKQKKAIIRDWHEKIKFNFFVDELKKLKSKKEIIYFKFEPPIYHIVCFNPDVAAKIVNIARQIGFKKSGFYYGKRGFPLAEIRGSEEISMPIFYKKILVDENFLRVLIKEVNKKFSQIWRKQKKFLKEIKKLNKTLSLLFPSFIRAF
jgi:tRNA wybutosine-synthesizing protein 3